MGAEERKPDAALKIGAFHIEQMTASQREVHNAIASGPRKDVPWPFLAMLDAPAIAHSIQAVGSAIRFDACCPLELREVATLATAAAFGSGYEWDYHVAIARKCGIAEHVIAHAAGKGAGDVDPAIACVIRLCREAVLQRNIPQAALNDVLAHHGREIASEIVAIAGYYQMLALFLSAADLDRPVVFETLS